MFFGGAVSVRESGGRNRFSLRRFVAAASHFTKSLGLVAAMSTGVAISTSQSAFAQVDREARINALLAANPGLRYVADTDKFFRVRRHLAVWVNAEIHVRFLETLNGVTGQLARIESLADNQIAQELTVGVGNLWIGATDVDVEGTFRWRTKGTPSDIFGKVRARSGCWRSIYSLRDRRTE